MTVKVYNMIPDQGSSTMSSSACFRVISILTLIIYQVSFTTAALPNPPVKLTASEITPSSLKLSWKPGNPDDISYIVQYKAKADQGDYKEIKSIKKTEFTIVKMNAFQHYQLRAIAVTKTGRSLPSAVIEVVTGELGGYHNCTDFGKRFGGRLTYILGEHRFFSSVLNTQCIILIILLYNIYF